MGRASALVAEEGQALSLFDPGLRPEHPAKFSRSVLAALSHALSEEVLGRPYYEVYPPVFGDQTLGGLRVLDPFAGTGLIHVLQDYSYTSPFQTWGVELEPEWAAYHPRTIVGDARELPFPDATLDVIATSCVYGNRMSDHHNARDDSVRHTYRHMLGRELSPGNAGELQWGEQYRKFHTTVWRECWRVLRPGGLILMNIKDHVRAGRVIEVAAWHQTELERNFTIETVEHVDTPGFRRGANRDTRVEGEVIIHGRKPLAVL